MKDPVPGWNDIDWDKLEADLLGDGDAADGERLRNIDLLLEDPDDAAAIQLTKAYAQAIEIGLELEDESINQLHADMHNAWRYRTNNRVFITGHVRVYTDEVDDEGEARFEEKNLDREELIFRGIGCEEEVAFVFSAVDDDDEEPDEPIFCPVADLVQLEFAYPSYERAEAILSQVVPDVLTELERMTENVESEIDILMALRSLDLSSLDTLPEKEQDLVIRSLEAYTNFNVSFDEAFGYLIILAKDYSDEDGDEELPTASDRLLTKLYEFGISRKGEAGADEVLLWVSAQQFNTRTGHEFEVRHLPLILVDRVISVRQLALATRLLTDQED